MDAINVTAAVGQGGLMTGSAPVLAQTQMPFAAFRRQLRNPINDMPPYPENLLSEKEAADIFAYLQSLPGRRPVKDFRFSTTDSWGTQCDSMYRP